MTSAFQEYHAQRGATPHCLCGSFSQAQHAGEHHFSRPWWHSGPNGTSQTPQCSLASSVLLPKIGFDPLTHGPFIQHKRHMRYSQSWLLATAKPGLFNQGCICWLRFATQQCTLYRSAQPRHTRANSFTGPTIAADGARSPTAFSPYHLSPLGALCRSIRRPRRLVLAPPVQSPGAGAGPRPTARTPAASG